jgi:hypothetical protein
LRVCVVLLGGATAMGMVEDAVGTLSKVKLLDGVAPCVEGAAGGSYTGVPGGTTIEAEDKDDDDDDETDGVVADTGAATNGRLLAAGLDSFWPKAKACAGENRRAVRGEAAAEAETAEGVALATGAAVAVVEVGGEKMSAVDAMRTLRADVAAVGWRGGVLGGMDRMAMGRIGPPGVIMVLANATTGAEAEAGAGAGAAPGWATCIGAREAGAGDGAKTESENAATEDAMGHARYKIHQLHVTQIATNM